MFIIIIVSSIVGVAIGSCVYISKRRFEQKINEVQHTEVAPILVDDSLEKEMDRFEQLKLNLTEIRKNVSELDIPTPDPLTSYDDTESTLDKLNKYFEKHSEAFAGTEAFILSILPISQTGEALCAFASVAPDMVSEGFSSSLSALQNGAVNPLDIHNCLSRFCEGMLHNHAHSLTGAIAGGFKEISGINDATGSIKDSFHGMSETLKDHVDAYIDPTDLTDWDVTGHIPLATIAFSSYRECKLLLNEKTDAMNALKNISLDAVGAGGGGFVGAKTGALIGSMFGPVGTLFGGIVGCIAGAVGGRAITNNIKQMALHEAIENYQSSATTMKEETEEKSKYTLYSIQSFAEEKRQEFRGNDKLNDIPVMTSEDIITGIAVTIYNAITEHINNMKVHLDKIKSSFWYSKSKHELIIEKYENEIANIEQQLPPLDNIHRNANLAIETLLALEMPVGKQDVAFKNAINECSEGLKEINDKNNSSLLVWSYMINGVYQQTLNEIADFSNMKMKEFTDFIDNWKQIMNDLEAKVKIEKDKLGL